MKVCAGNRGWQSKGDAMAWLHTVVSSSSFYALLSFSAWHQGELSAPLQRPPPIVSAARPIRKRNLRGPCNESWAIANACKIRTTDTVGRMYRRTRGKQQTSRRTAEGSDSRRVILYGEEVRGPRTRLPKDYERGDAAGRKRDTRGRQTAGTSQERNEKGMRR